MRSIVVTILVVVLLTPCAAGCAGTLPSSTTPAVSEARRGGGHSTPQQRAVAGGVIAGLGLALVGTGFVALGQAGEDPHSNEIGAGAVAVIGGTLFTVFGIWMLTSNLASPSKPAPVFIGPPAPGRFAHDVE